MDISVMQTSGDIDSWTDVENAVVDMNLGGALLIKKNVTVVVTAEQAAEAEQQLLDTGARPGSPIYTRERAKLPKQGDEITVERNLAVYAGGMWMKFEVDSD